jgi:hypothetical protein
MQGSSRQARRIISSLLFSGALLLFSAHVTVAQVSSPRPTPTPPRPNDSITADKNSASDNSSPMTSFEEEIRAKREIKLAEKEHQENLNRAREISQIGKELQEGLRNRPLLQREDVKKVDRLEKLTKKVRGEAGGEDGEINLVSRPVDLDSTITRISEMTESLSKNVKNTPRQVVSAAVIDNANVILELIRILRTFSRGPAQ